MTLRNKILVTVSTTFAVLILILYITSQLIVIQGFTKLEQDTVRRNVSRVLNGLSEELSILNLTLGDWAAWDDTCEFVQNANQKYYDDNFGDLVFENLKLNLMLFINVSGHIVGGKSFDLINKKEVPVPASVREYINNSEKILDHKDTKSSLAGIILTKEGPMLIVSRPIVTNEYKGPIRGTLIMGYYLNSSRIEHLSKSMHLILNVYRLDDSEVSSDFQEMELLPKDSDNVYIRPLGPQLIAGYTLLKDIHDTPILVLRVDMPRDIYKQGKASIFYLISSLVVIGLVFATLTLVLLEKMVLSRLAQLSTGVRHISVSTDLSARVHVKGNDELSNLAFAINSMLVALERSQEEINRAVMSSITSHIAVLDNHGNVITINDAWERFAIENGHKALTDLKRGINYAELLRREQSPAHDDNFDTVLNGIRSVLDGSESHFTSMYPCETRTARYWFLLSVTPLIRKRGEVVISRIDVTDRKQAEEERLRLATAIEQAAESVVITNSLGTIQYVNPAFERLTGYTRSEVIGRNPRILSSGRHDAHFYRVMWETMTRGEVWSGRLTNRRKDGTLHEVEATISPIRNESNAIISYVSVQRDVTREIELERQLRQAQKMEAIGTLAGGIAHDFNNVLAAIMGYGELSLSELPEDHPARYDMDQVIKAALRAREVVRQILTFSRQGEQEQKPVQIGYIVKEALRLLRASLPTTIEIDWDIRAESDTVLADPGQIHQLIMNLCTNAGHAMQEKGGILRVSLHEVDLDSETAGLFPDLHEGTYLKLTVSDTGHGMDQKTIERIFDPYFTTKRLGEGTGLGLAVVHGIVKRLSGSISVSSEPDKGTVFNIFLPSLKDYGMVTEDYPDPIRTGNEKILLVDDEEAIVESESRLLKLLGYEVVATNSGLEALEFFKKKPNRFDLVIMDQTMPNMTGTELAKEFLSLRPGIPIILCTGFSNSVTREEAKAIGIKKFLMKPLTLSDLSKAIERALGEREEDTN